MTILPSQARDEHRENSKAPVFLQLLALPHELFGARAFSQENGTGAKLHALFWSHS
jgi:hypothetical protein